MIEKHGLILKNKPEIANRPTRWNKTSIIYLTFNIREIRAPDTWMIDEELSTPSDDEVIVYDTAGLDEAVRRMGTSQ